jgi:pimeloyl-ACP methyl ester carboxylesterase
MPDDVRPLGCEPALIDPNRSLEDTMSTTDSTTADTGQCVHANGIDIHYLDQGEGETLVLLHGGVVSTNPIWTGVPVAYASHMDTLADHFRVIAPDTRGCGKTVHTGGPISFDLLNDDIAALIDALGLERPLIAGFSEGAITATVLGIRHPDAIRAIVNDAGFDAFDPKAPTIAMMRQILGGSPDATEPDPDAAARGFEASEQMRAMFELMKRDQDSGQGEGHWRTYLRLSWDRCTQPPGYTYADLAKITAPTLILVGDRDDFCTAEQAVTAHRQLRDGELAILPNTGHLITPAAIETTIAFFERQLASPSDSAPAAG